MIKPKVKLSPVENIVIHSYQIYDKDDLVKRVVHHAISHGFIPHLFWVGGWLIDYNSMDNTEFIQRERIENKTMHIQNMLLAKMPVYTDKIALQHGGHLLISDVSYDTNLTTVIQTFEDLNKK